MSLLFEVPLQTQALQILENLKNYQKAPQDYQESISECLQSVMDNNSFRNSEEIEDKIKPFCAKKVPSISIQDYLRRIKKFLKIDDCIMTIALIYIDRVQALNKLYFLTPQSVHRLLITAIVIASKFFCDEFYKNDYYAKVGGISLQEMNSLELYFFELLNFRLFVNEELQSLYNNKLNQQKEQQIEENQQE